MQANSGKALVGANVKNRGERSKNYKDEYVVDGVNEA